MGDDRDDDLPVIELSTDAPPPRAPRPHDGDRRRAIALVTAAALVVVAATTYAVTRQKHPHRSASSPPTVVLPDETRSGPTTATVNANAEVVNDMHLVAPGTGWVLTAVGLSLTRDDGAHWRTITPPGIDNPMGTIAAVTFLDVDHGWVVVSAPSTTFTIWRTDDGARSWTRLRPTVCRAFPCGWSMSFDFVDARHGWAEFSNRTGGGTLAASDDGGATWTTIAPTPFGGTIRFVDTRHGWAVSGPSLDVRGLEPGGVIWRTTDGGHTWRAAAPPVHVSPGGRSMPIDGPRFFGPDVVVAASDTRDHAPDAVTVAVSYDGGATWTVRPTPLTGGALTAPASTVRFTAVSTADWTLLVGPHLYVTDDAGDHWKTLTPTGGTLRDLSFVFGNEGWIIADAHPCNASGIGCPTSLLFTTVDGGATWNLRSPTFGVTTNRSP